MKITLDEATLRQAVISHLRTVGVTADIPQVVFRYTRVPYTVFAEVELAEQAPPAPRAAAVVKEREVLPPAPILDPLTVLPAEEPAPEAPVPDGPAEPLFGGG